MPKELHCADVGLDCDFVARGESTDAILEQVVTHAAEVHGITEITPELQAKVTSAIREPSADA